MTVLTKYYASLESKGEAMAKIAEFRNLLKNDKEMFYGHQSAIAVCIMDEIARTKKKLDKQSLNSGEIHEAANEAAKNYLNMFIKD